MKKYKKGEIVKNIFKAAGIGIAFGAAIVMPGLAISLGSLARAMEENEFKIDKTKLKRSLKGLEERKLVSLREEGDKLIVEFTKEGINEVFKYKIKDLIIKKPKKWDKKWRLVIFDIPEKKKLARNILRRKLKDLGFVFLQKSVFVYPFPCRKEISFLIKILELEPYVVFIEADYISRQKHFLRKFGL